jgi:cystathionine gamma-synthase
MTFPDLKRIRTIAKLYSIPVVIDDTLSTAVNVDLTPYADVIWSSLTKAFSGKCNVMGGR